MSCITLHTCKERKILVEQYETDDNVRLLALKNKDKHQINIIVNIEHSKPKTLPVPMNFSVVDGLADHLTNAYKTECLMNMNIPQLIKAIYCNVGCPQNHRIRLINKKEKLFEVVDNGWWVSRCGDAVLKELADNGRRVLSQHWRDNKDEVDEQLHDYGVYHKVKHWMDNVCDDDPKIYKSMKQEILLVFVDQKRIVMLSK